MMHVFMILTIVGMLAAGVIWIDRSAVSRVESERMLVAMKVQKTSTADVRAREQTELTARASRIRQLEAEIAAIPPAPEPLDEYCRPGCIIQWTE